MIILEGSLNRFRLRGQGSSTSAVSRLAGRIEQPFVRISNRDRTIHPGENPAGANLCNSWITKMGYRNF